MKDRTLRHSLGASLAVTFITAAAIAQSSTQSTGAQALQEDAHELMKQGDFEHACPKFKHSYDLDPDGGTLLNLALCYEKQGKFASAWSTFRQALLVAQRDGQSERVDAAQQHLAVVEPKLSKLTIQVASEVNEPGLSVTLDGTTLAAGTWGVGIPLDPGRHQVTASAPNKATFEQGIELETGAFTIQIPKLADAAATAAEPRLIDTDTEKKPVTNEAKAGSSVRRTVGYVVAGVGVASLGFGSYFGVRAFSKWSERQDNCVGGCNDAAKRAGDDAQLAATASTTSMVLGLADIAIGSCLVLSSQPSSTPKAAQRQGVLQARSIQVLPTFGATGGGLLLRGAY